MDLIPQRRKAHDETGLADPSLFAEFRHEIERMFDRFAHDWLSAYSPFERFGGERDFLPAVADVSE